ncbi:ATP synthase subunit d, mitochondrial [Ptiloglossa arizonensis]|uniref:ATP synthase subunit d, mitochondrial n=1 Tax=Ptiloglossa arizonensis TaxID=3350558 RepID=UPI003F9EEABB
MSRNAIKSINWAAISERIAETEKNSLAAFKAKSDQYLRRMAALPEDVPKIDWTYYKKSIVTPGLVEKFQKEYEALSIPYPVDKYTAEIESEEKQLSQNVEQFCRETDQRIEDSRKEIERIKGLLPIEEMTMEDFRDAYPELAFNPEKPTTWPHDPEDQVDEDEESTKLESQQKDH